MALAVATCSSLTLMPGASAGAAEPAAPPAAGTPDNAVPAQIEGESDFANSGESTGVYQIQAAATATVPDSPNFGPAIDGYASNDPQSSCDPTEKPGPVALRALLNKTYGFNRTGNITRACGSGGTSEHKEGRALDYMLDSTDTSERDIANTVLDWMLDTDSHGNKHANARRLGVMYLIWNKRIWSAARQSEGWRTYTGSNPHTDHIHVSFSWAGARKQTTWWTAALPEGPGSFSGDGKADLLVHGVQGDISARINQGTWFDGGSTVSQGWSNYMGYNGSGRLYFADINGDRKTDMLVHGTDGVISVRYNKGTYWDAGRTITQGWGNFLGYPGKGRLYFADYNGDGRADLFVHGVDGVISVRINRGTWFDGGRTASQGWSNFMGYNGSGLLYFADINGDRKTDMLVHGVDGVVSVRYNMGTYFDGGRTLTQGWGNFLGYPGKGKLYLADINDDGKADLLVHGTDGVVSVRYNQGTWFDGGRTLTQGWGNFLGNPDQGRLYFG